MRLTTTNKDVTREMICRNEDCGVKEEHCPHLMEDECACLREVINKLADYEDAEAQGLLLRFPCKAGDTVFLVQHGNLYERKVNGFSITSNNRLVIHVPDFEMDNASFPEHTFGKIVFFDHKKAEAALAEIRSTEGTRSTETTQMSR